MSIRIVVRIYRSVLLIEIKIGLPYRDQRGTSRKAVGDGMVSFFTSFCPCPNRVSQCEPSQCGLTRTIGHVSGKKTVIQLNSPMKCQIKLLLVD